MATLVLQTAGAAIGGMFGPVGAIVGRAIGGLAGAAIDKSFLGASSSGQASHYGTSSEDRRSAGLAGRPLAVHASGAPDEPMPSWNKERQPMPPFTRPTRRVLAAVSLMLGLTGCARTMVSAGTDPGLACRAFGPITYSRADTEASQRQSREHNAAWAAVCRK
jgi:hypothetical protein